MSRTICPYSEEEQAIVCIAESRGDDMVCEECPIKKEGDGE